MRKSSILIAGLGTMAGLGMLHNRLAFDTAHAGLFGAPPPLYRSSRKTVSAAALKRAAKKRRNMRARSAK